MNLLQTDLILMHFVDEGDIHIMYAPQLDVSGYGLTKEEASDSLEYSLEDFVQGNKIEETFEKVLLDLGWQFESRAGTLEEFIAPPLSLLIKNNDYISEIFDKYAVHTFQRNSGMLTSVA